MKRWGVACVLLATIFALSPQLVAAAKGSIVYNRSGCDYFIVETLMGYALLEWFGGYDPSEGDIIVGDFESYGMKTVNNLTSGTKTQVWVEDFWLSKDSVVEKYYDHCD